jgi:putative hemolysin
MKFLTLLFVLILGVFLLGCSSTSSRESIPKESPKASEEAADLPYDQTQQDTNSQIANPASVNCAKNSGKVVIRTAADGSQTGYCIFEDSKECEEWAFYRGECKP